MSPMQTLYQWGWAIERLLTDKVERKRMGQMARKLILAERTPDQAARRLDDILVQWAQPK